MKKAYLLILAVVALIGCSKHDPDKIQDPNAWIEDEALPVPIMFGASGTEQMTKAIFDGASLPAGTQVGILGLEHGGAWGATESAAGVLVDNTNYASIDNDGSIIFSEKKFYPTDNSQNFTFYGYHPYEGVNGHGSIQPGYNYFEIKYKIDGQTDVLWAKAEAIPFTYNSSTVTGFNGGYIRKSMKHGRREEDYLPNLNFEHKLAYLDFKLQVNEDDVSELSSLGLEVTGLTLKNVYTTAKLVIAKNDGAGDGNPAGTLYGVEPKSSLALGGVTAPIAMNTTGKHDFGSGLLVVPESEYQAQLEMQVTGRTTPLTADLTFKLDGGKSFEAGKKYNMIIVVRAPKEIVIRTELTDWEDNGDVIIDQINQN